jgi:hypothetical protein
MVEPKSQAMEVTLRKLAELLKKANEGAPGNVHTGACVYSAGVGTYCADGFTQAQCDNLGGIWTDGGQCP